MLAPLRGALFDDTLQSVFISRFYNELIYINYLQWTRDMNFYNDFTSYKYILNEKSHFPR